MSCIKLKLNIGSAVLAAPPLTTPTTATPGGSRPKLKFTNTSSVPPTPTVSQEPPKPKKTKAGRTPKASAKAAASLKRIKDESESGEEGSTINVLPPAKKLKLQFSAGPKTPVTPVVLKAKVKGKPPKRPTGEGYDSEASDREEDPAIEEEFVLRMFPGDDCEYLRQAIADKKIGLPKGPPHYGADVQMKFFHGDGRRAAVTVRRNVYAATLVDLPCVIEGMKSWDKRGWWKTADICQMLWVFAPIKNENEAKTIALPSIIDPETYQYPHGLTPPMHFARKRRFRKRLHKTQIEAVEDAVDRLLQADRDAESTSYVVIDPDAEYRSQAFSPTSSQGGYEDGEGYTEDEDAEGEADDSGYFGTTHHANGHVDDDLDADLEADIEAAMQAEFNTPSVPATPMANGDTPAVEEDSGDESIEDDDGEEDGAGAVDEIDEEEKARLAQIQGTMEDIADLEKQIANVQAQLATQGNPILKRRLEDNSRKLKQELQLKKSSIGEGDENE